MQCEYYRELISTALDGELVEAEKQELDRHLAVCPSCRSLAQEMETVHAFTLSAPPLSLPKDRQKVILQETVGTIRGRPRLRRGGLRGLPTPRTLAWAGSVLLLILLGGVSAKLIWFDSASREPRPAPHRGAFPLHKITLSDDDIISTRSTVTIAITDRDIVNSISIVFPGGET